MGKKIAVLGAGCSGLVAIKSCLDEGLEPVCLEKTGFIGGLWRYTTEVHDDEACVMKSTVINTSKEMMCYSDFPIPDDFANLMHNTKVFEYFNLFADKFGLRDYIRFHTEVLSVTPVEDFPNTGQWLIETRNRQNDATSSEVFDGVMVCTGHHTEKKMPEFEGMDEFQGRFVHTHDYKDHVGLEDKRVVVIGIGNSGGDTVIETSRVAKQVFLSTKRGAWVMKRVDPSGYPFDWVFNRRYFQGALGALPSALRLAYLESQTNGQFNHALYNMTPVHRFDAAHPLVCDDLANRIVCGAVKVKPNIKRFTKTGVEFEDGTFEDNIDLVICATGYLFGFPFVKHPALEVKDNQINFFKYCFPPDIKPATLAVIGCIQPWGAIMPIAELQCRWAARVFKGLAHLPEASDMWEDIRAKQSQMADRYVSSSRHTIQVDWIDFMDQVAEQIGCKPDLKQMLFEDPFLFKEVYFGPCTPYQFRLHGPGVWSGARKAIMTQWDRVHKPTQTRKFKIEKTTYDYAMMAIKIIVVLWVIRWFFL